MRAGLGNQLAYSVLAQFIRYGFPLLLYPILIRTLGADGFAEFVIVAAVGQMIGQFTEFGFGLSAVRELAEAKASGGPAKQAVGQVFVGKSILFVLTALVAAVILWLTGDLAATPGLYAIAFLMGAAYGFTPNWYYIGTGNAKALAFLEMAVSVTQLALILLFVSQAGEVARAILCMALPMLALAIYGQFAAVRALSFGLPGVREMWSATVIASRIFISTNASSLSNKILLLMLGAFSTNLQVAYYAAGERIVTAGVNTLTPVTRVVMPRMAELIAGAPDEARRLFRQALIGALVFYGAGSVALMAAAPWWVPLVFGSEMTGAVMAIALFLVVIPISAAGRVVGLLGLVPMRRERLYQRITLASCLIGIAAALPLASVEGATGLVMVRIAMELAIAAGCFVAMSRARRSAVPG